MITLQLTPAQSGLLIEAMKKRIDRSNQKLKYWQSHPEAKAPNGYVSIHIRHCWRMN